MSEHEEEFREKIQQFFECWIAGVGAALEEMIQQNQLDSTIDTKKSAQALIAMIQGGTLLMKNYQDIQLLINVIDVTREQFHLS
jgi:TetR/AcrR family transcriptional repressor of nem operon